MSTTRSGNHVQKHPGKEESRKGRKKQIGKQEAGKLATSLILLAPPWNSLVIEVPIV